VKRRRQCSKEDKRLGRDFSSKVIYQTSRQKCIVSQVEKVFFIELLSLKVGKNIPFDWHLFAFHSGRN